MEKEILATMLGTLSENMELMFQKKSTLSGDFIECSRPEFTDGYMGMISLANQSCQGQMVIGMSESIIQDLLQEVMQLVSSPEESKELVKASLGELLNTVSGAFAQDEIVLGKYDSLDLSTPMVWGLGEEPYFCKTEGMSGSLTYHNGETIHLFLAINPYKVFESSDDSGDSSSASDFLGDDLDDLLSGL